MENQRREPPERLAHHIDFCYYCKKGFERTNGLASHNSSIHRDCTHRCNVCQNLLKTSVAFGAHQATWGDKGRPSKKFKFPNKEHKGPVLADDDSYHPEDKDDYHDGEGKKRDLTILELKPDYGNRPLWASADDRIFLETFSPLYKQAYDFLIVIAEPVCRLESIHKYNLTPHSLYAAVSVGLELETSIAVLYKLSKTRLPKEMIDFIHASTANYGKVKLVIEKNQYHIESPFSEVLKTLLKDEVIGQARISNEGIHGNGGFTLSKFVGGIEGRNDELLNEVELATAVEEKETRSFETGPAEVENVKQHCQPNALNYRMFEEYDFRNDTVNPDLDMELKPQAQPQPCQEKSISKMSGNGRARSGIIVLPCGTGKSLVGVCAACRIRKSYLCLATNDVSVHEWASQFKLWSKIWDEQICHFTSGSEERFCGNAGVVVTTYNMVAFGGKRSEKETRNREWRLLQMDEVHLFPAHMFRKVISLTKSHCKLGLTAILVREDERITDLNFLIGPKLYELAAPEYCFFGSPWRLENFLRFPILKIAAPELYFFGRPGGWKTSLLTRFW